MASLISARSYFLGRLGTRLAITFTSSPHEFPLSSLLPHSVHSENKTLFSSFTMAFKSGSFATFLILCREFPSHNPPIALRPPRPQVKSAPTRAHPNTHHPQDNFHSLTVPCSSNMFLPGHHLLHVPLRLPNPVVHDPNPGLTL